MHAIDITDRYITHSCPRNSSKQIRRNFDLCEYREKSMAKPTRQLYWQIKCICNDFTVMEQRQRYSLGADPKLSLFLNLIFF